MIFSAYYFYRSVEVSVRAAGGGATYLRYDTLISGALFLGQAADDLE